MRPCHLLIATALTCLTALPAAADQHLWTLLKSDGNIQQIELVTERLEGAYIDGVRTGSIGIIMEDVCVIELNECKNSRCTGTIVRQNGAEGEIDIPHGLSFRFKSALGNFSLPALKVRSLSRCP